MAEKTTKVYLDEYKERLREAFGEYSGAAENYDPAAEDGSEQKEKLGDLKNKVEGILAEVTPSELVEEEPEQESETEEIPPGPEEEDPDAPKKKGKEKDGLNLDRGY